ncbi:MAG: DUF3616 domain-containing protein [Betaproteobacteria bacterium]|nr:DUF3616 domain-containing protein [Betaproteobacteria bacterium]
MFQTLTGIYEPSAIVQLPDGRFLVAEDEKAHPFRLLTISADGKVDSTALTPGFFEGGDSFWKLDDLEGLTVDRSGNIYAITSHSRDGDGDEKKGRNKLARFRVDGRRVAATKVAQGFKAALLAAHPVLAAAAGVRDVKIDGGLNIEALEISADGQRLLLGFRSPLLDRQAIVATVENPSAIFDVDEAPHVSPTLETLALGGNGIRGMSYLPFLDGYLLIAGPAGREPLPFQLWFWSGQPGASARQVTIPGLHGLEHAEGISPATIGGRQRIVIVSDDGDRKAGRFARFLLLDPQQLQIAP